MTLLQMKYFIAAATTRSISKAASDLFISRTAVSRAIRDLEQEFGITLFVRNKAGLMLTEDGGFVYKKCNDILSEAECFQRQMESLRIQRLQKQKTSIKMEVSTFAALVIFPQFYGELKRKFPDIMIDALEMGYNDAEKRLLDGTIDCWLKTYYLQEDMPEGIEKIVFKNTELVLVVPTGHRLSTQASVTVEDFKDEPLIFLPQYYQNEYRLRERFAAAGYTLNVLMRVQQIQAAIEMTVAGAGCSVLIRDCVVSNKNVVPVSFCPPIYLDVLLTWNAAIPHTNAFYKLIEFAESYKKTIPK